MPPALSQLTLHHHHIMPKNSAALYREKKRKAPFVDGGDRFIVGWPLLKETNRCSFYTDRKGDQ